MATKNGVVVAKSIDATDYLEGYDGGANRDVLIPYSILAAALKATNRVNDPIILVIGDETTAQTVADGKLTFRMPYAFTLTSVRASLVTAPTDADFVVDITEGGTTILSTLLTIDATEKTSTTSAAPAVISDPDLADDAEIVINVDQIGSTVAGAGLKVYLIGYPA